MRCHLPRASPGILGFLFLLSILLDSHFEIDLLFRCHFPAPASTQTPRPGLLGLILILLVLGLILVLRRGLLGLILVLRRANYIKCSLGVPHFPYEPRSKQTYANECDDCYRRQEDN